MRRYCRVRQSAQTSVEQATHDQAALQCIGCSQRAQYATQGSLGNMRQQQDGNARPTALVPLHLWFELANRTSHAVPCRAQAQLLLPTHLRAGSISVWKPKWLRRLQNQSQRMQSSNGTPMATNSYHLCMSQMIGTLVAMATVESWSVFHCAQTWLQRLQNAKAVSYLCRASPWLTHSRVAYKPHPPLLGNRACRARRDSD
jgi:hypothetical protein